MCKKGLAHLINMFFNDLAKATEFMLFKLAHETNYKVRWQITKRGLYGPTLASKIQNVQVQNAQDMV